ncbi:MAG: type II toxin-antitoxin system VapC family toxin [Caulobacterales bacterium]
MSRYLDASIILPLLNRESTSPAVERLLAERSSDLCVSEFAAAEVASALSRLVRTQRLTVGQATSRLSDFDAWREADTAAVEIEDADVRLASLIVRRFELKLRAPDALHLAMAQRLGATLLTLDKRLTAAAAACGQPVMAP